MSILVHVKGLIAQTPPPLPPQPDDVREAISTATSQGANLGIWGPLGSIVLLVVGALLGIGVLGGLLNIGVGTAKMGLRAGNTAEMAKAKSQISQAGVIVLAIAGLFFIGGVVLAFLSYFGV